ncbi:MAG: type VI secretion system tube protein Hcp [Acidobacteriia bacterium]|nr:type VI secretion system tube protein Hcp [Terriglobia bacterium]
MAVDFFLKIDGIPGESQDSKHKDEIQLMSWSWGESQTGTMAFGGGGGAGKVNMHDFAFVMSVNKASPKLLLACANGEHIKNATLVARKAGKDQQEYLTIKFTDLLVSAFQTGGSGDLPTDSISFNYGKIEYEYKEQNVDGTLKGPIKVWYDLKKSQGG